MHQAWLWDIRPGVGFGKFWARAAFWEERVDRDVVRVIFFYFFPCFSFLPSKSP